LVVLMVVASALFVDALLDVVSRPTSVYLLYEVFIPGLSCLSFCMSVVLAFRSGGGCSAFFLSSASSSPSSASSSSSCSSSTSSFSATGDEKNVEKLALRRRGLWVSTASVLFAFACLYRSLNIADEGAAMCRGRPTSFNAPVSGRLVATVGEIALVLQVQLFITETTLRLGAQARLFAAMFKRILRIPYQNVWPVLIAEALSWQGVLSGNSKFYCAEYVLWLLVAIAWMWDGMEIYKKSLGKIDRLVGVSLLVAGFGLFCFDALYEIPHFFAYHREGTAASALPTGIWECLQEKDSPLWLKRLPFFFIYFVCCSWGSVIMAQRFVDLSLQY